MLKVVTDPQADAIYIYLRTLPVAYTEELDENRYVDYGADGEPVGIDLLQVSEGVNTDDLPQQAEVEKVLTGLGVKILV